MSCSKWRNYWGSTLFCYTLEYNIPPSIFWIQHAYAKKEQIWNSLSLINRGQLSPWRLSCTKTVIHIKSRLEVIHQHLAQSADWTNFPFICSRPSLLVWKVCCTSIWTQCLWLNLHSDTRHAFLIQICVFFLLTLSLLVFFLATQNWPSYASCSG